MARDAMLVAAVAYYKRQLGRDSPTLVTEFGRDRLKALQAQLVALARHTIEGNKVK